MKYYIICDNGYEQVSALEFSNFIHDYCEDYDIEVLCFDRDKICYYEKIDDEGTELMIAYTEL